MFDGLITFSISTSADPPVTLKGLQTSPESALPPLLLLHGFPQTRHIWHRIAPQLTTTYNLIIPDLRGYGESSKPSSIAAYAKSAMAKDMIALMNQLNHQTFFVCAHDRGARVAHKLLVDYPSHVRRAILLDICPTLSMYEATTQYFATAYFHWFFLIQPAPLPEALISATPRRFAELYMGGRNGSRPDIFDEACYEEYVKLFEDEDTVHAMCNDYRAAATLDLDEQKADLKEGRLIKSPVRIIWAKRGIVGKCFDATAEWRKVADEGVVVEGYGVDSGHYIPEEAPYEVAKAIREFFV
ncbi:Epoxide hydrolase-like protein [Metarhizium album ARSEF 1941]|uniref:Epoxide hydrolase-like protein n=1 Tax=Metarhizium album (strain ARSEF 1941) TaxID=1081103 RepID=A0A0B2WQW6_METAS|nr:Epoxide hydrolase-like protein [Metarhizium album ARSEF 1941]KHN98456.1 Epoxide hydrolase-like protein [Metarhizium album ARSEF 1941]